MSWVCTSCNKINGSSQIKCECGSKQQVIDGIPDPKLTKSSHIRALMGNDEQLNDYIRDPFGGIYWIALNGIILSTIPLFALFGRIFLIPSVGVIIGYLLFLLVPMISLIPLIIAYSLLKRKGVGILYSTLISVAFLLSQYFDVNYYNKDAAEISALLVVILFLLAVINANRILFKYNKLSKNRIKEIDNISNYQEDGLLLMEKGLLQWKVLRQKRNALPNVRKAVEIENILAADLLFAAGKLFNQKGMKEKAKEVLEIAFRNSSNDDDDNMPYRIKRYLNKI
jgi:hypothetical protein